jgi:16S rRNA (uracil1498-N3)-methyltransferase
MGYLMSPRSRERKIFISCKELFPDSIRFSSTNIHYLKNVLRLKTGDPVTVLDGCRSYHVILKRSAEGTLVGAIVDSCEEGSSFPVRVELAFGCVRPGPTEEILRHCTELGVESFFPLLLERSSRRPESTRTRWLKIASSACAQSGRTIMPEINDPTILEVFVDKIRPGSMIIYLTVDRTAIPMAQVLDRLESNSVTILVGPEGGLTTAEESMLAGAGCVFSSLGGFSLRTETAAILGAGLVTSWAFARSKPSTAIVGHEKKREK